MRGFIRCLFLLTLAAAPLVHANEQQACDASVIDAVSDWAHVSDDPVKAYGRDGDDTDFASACKTMPDAPDITLATMAFAKSGTKYGKLQVIAMVQQGRVVAGAREDIDEDAAFSVGDFSIDTARYTLAKGVRAFGVKIASGTSGPKCADADAGGPLTLWIREGKKLRPVMTTNLWGVYNLVGVTGCSDDSVSETADITVHVEKTTSHGFADLTLVAQVERSTFKHRDEVKTERRVERQILHYDGTTYGSNDFREFWYGDTP